MKLYETHILKFTIIYHDIPWYIICIYIYMYDYICIYHTWQCVLNLSVPQVWGFTWLSARRIRLPTNDYSAGMIIGNLWSRPSSSIQVCQRHPNELYRSLARLGNVTWRRGILNSLPTTSQTLRVKSKSYWMLLVVILSPTLPNYSWQFIAVPEF